jgi:hypothetical protein
MASYHRLIKKFFLILLAIYFGISCASKPDKLSLPSSSSAAEKVPKIVAKGPRNKPQAAASKYDIGVFYMPGWQSGNIFWHDLLGTKSARFPGKSWPDRIPILGTYPEEKIWVKDWHIKWAVEHGISFFVYDWFWTNGKPHAEHAILAHLRSPYKDLLKFCIMWTNHDPFIPKLSDVDDVAKHWIEHYFKQPNYKKINGKPVVMVFLPDRIGGKPDNTQRAISTIRKLTKKAGYKDIFLVAISNDPPAKGIVNYFKTSGYNAYTAYNYASSTRGIKKASYDTLIWVYTQNWRKSVHITGLPYITPITPGWDSRPWHGKDAIVLANNTPDKFRYKLTLAKGMLDSYKGPNVMPNMVLIEAWNEFAEGSFIEPTRKWGFGYLDAIREVFTNKPQKHQDDYPMEMK